MPTCDDISIRVPAALKDLADGMSSVLDAVQTLLRRSQGGKSLDYAKVEMEIADEVARIERAAHGAVLRGLNETSPRIAYQGDGWYLVAVDVEQEYRTRAGPVVVPRSLYRKTGDHNGRTIDPVSVRAGVLGDGWLPNVSKEMGFELQRGTSREAEQAARVHGILPYSRASFERVGHMVGEQYLKHQATIEDELVSLMDLPPAAVGLSISIDRGSIPMEEPASSEEKVAAVARGEKTPEVVRAFRMGYCGTISFFDQEGEAVHTTRYGLMPGNDPMSLCRLMGADVSVILQHAPALTFHAVGDGAPEMWNLLGEVATIAGRRPDAEFIDFCHVVEKVGKAAVVAFGEKDGAARIDPWVSALKREPKAAERIHDELMLCGHPDVNSKQGAIHDALTYIQNNSARMNYADGIARGLPIGSGIVEATVKSLIEGRMKRPGARWKNRSGNHVLQLRALANSDRWDAAIDLALKPLRHSIRVAA
jgi:hypothetical protein